MSVVADKEAIRELLHRYCFCMDEGRFADLAALFAEDGEWIAPYRTARGPADIAAWLQQSVPPQPRRMHYVMNSIIECDGAHATARSSVSANFGARGGECLRLERMTPPQTNLGLSH
jgi:hypothetical protein